MITAILSRPGRLKVTAGALLAQGVWVLRRVWALRKLTQAAQTNSSALASIQSDSQASGGSSSSSPGISHS